MEAQSGIRPLVGRDAEVEELTRTLDELGRGTASCITVEGEPGIGKTRLLGELQTLANTRGHVVLGGAGAEFEQALPFSVFVDALDAYVGSQRLDLHEAWNQDLERELGEVLPSLRVPGAEALADERYRAHRAIRDLLALLAADQPLVLVLDDLHWSDLASLELIAALIGRAPDAPVLIALGLRPGQAGERLELALSSPAVRRIELGELSEAQAAELLAGIDPQQVAAAYGHGGGNPFYLEQLGRSPGLTRTMSGSPHGSGVPPAVAAAIAEELASLPPQARLFLDGAAVAGEPFDPGLAATIGGLSDADGFAALDDLIAADLVRPTPVPRRFSFRHPLVRRAVYESTGGGWRLSAHARGASALAAQGAGATERAHHVEQSANKGDEAAISTLLEAGATATARAPANAARWFEAALRLLPAGDTQRQVDVRVSLASAQRSVGRHDECRDTLLEAAALLPPEAALRRIELTASCASVEHWQGRHEEAHRRLMRAWEVLPERSSPEAATLQMELAVDGMYQNDFDQTLTMGQAAYGIAVELDDGSLIASAAAVLALGTAAAGEVAAARQHRARALEQVERMEESQLAPRLETLYYLGWAENYLEHYDEAITHAAHGIAVARATGEGRLLVPLMLLPCYAFEMQGRLAEATEACEAAVEVAQLSATPHFLFWALCELAWARYYSGDLQGTLSAGDESVRISGRMSGGTMPSSGGGAGWAIAVARFELGEVALAHELMHEVGGSGMENWIPAERYFNWENLALAELALGQAGAAEELARCAENAAAEVDLHLPTLLSARTRAAVALAAGDTARAIEAARRSITAGTAIGADLQVAFARRVLGGALIEAGDRAGAIAALREAEHAFDVSGSVRMRDDARRELRKLGARAEARGPMPGDGSGLESLTSREREICELITDRLTNRQIAEELFLSRKTVETHIRNVFNKLGADSRVDVAKLVERERAG